jgi:hypothetical protein
MKDAQMERTTMMTMVIFFGLGPHMLFQLHSKTSLSLNTAPDPSMVREHGADVICIATTWKKSSKVTFGICNIFFYTYFIKNVPNNIYYILTDNH